MMELTNDGWRTSLDLIYFVLKLSRNFLPFEKIRILITSVQFIRNSNIAGNTHSNRQQVSYNDCFYNKMKNVFFCCGNLKLVCSLVVIIDNKLGMHELWLKNTLISLGYTQNR